MLYTELPTALELLTNGLELPPGVLLSNLLRVGPIVETNAAVGRTTRLTFIPTITSEECGAITLHYDQVDWGQRPSLQISTSTLAGLVTKIDLLEAVSVWLQVKVLPEDIVNDAITLINDSEGGISLYLQAASSSLLWTGSLKITVS